MTTPLMLGVDPGNGAIKIYGAAGGTQLPAIVANDGQRAIGRAVGLATVKPPLAVRTSAGTFFLGLGAHDWGRPIENMDHERFAGSPEMRALIYGALTQYQAQAETKAKAEVQGSGLDLSLNLDLSLTVGLPIEALSGPEDTVRGTVAAVKRWLEGDHTWEADGKTSAATIQSVNVTSQPVGALFDYLLDAEGSFVPEHKAHFRAEIGVVSVGMNTVELLVVRGGQVIPGDTAADRRGVRRLLELCNPDDLYTLGELDAQLRAGKLDIGQALPVWATEVTGFLERRWATKYRRFAAVILVGGGVKLLGQPLLTRFGGKAYVADDPVLATARGLYKQTLANAQRRG